MKDKIKQLVDRKEFHLCIFILIIVTILFVAGIIILKYNVEGETNLPFSLSKISAISSVEGIDNEDDQNKWNLTVNQNNDIYMYIQKNENYSGTEVIESIILDNFNSQNIANLGNKQLFRPDSSNTNPIFKNSNENITDKIQYFGNLQSDIKNLKISNQGGLIAFRYSTTNIGNFTSDEIDEVNHDHLLKDLNINNDNLKFNLLFDITIKLQTGKAFKANINLELPIDNVVENGTQSKEITELDNVIFKRINNE